MTKDQRNRYIVKMSDGSKHEVIARNVQDVRAYMRNNLPQAVEIQRRPSGKRTFKPVKV